MNIKQENSGDLVWARMRFCPYWPARIVNTPPEMGKTPRGKVCVLFFGTKEFGFVDKKKVENYTENRTKFYGKGKGLHFKDAVKQMDEYVADPVKFRAHAIVKPTMKRIPIKTERDVELRLGVKTERHSTGERAQRELKSTPMEKQALVNKIVVLTAENQRNMLTQKKMQTDYDALLLSKQQLERTILDNEEKFSARLKQLQLDIDKAKNEFEKMETSSQKVIRDLKRENQLLEARAKQYQTGMQQKTSFENRKDRSEKEEVDYEVDSILKHRNTSTGREFLIRWKNYGPDDDSWVKEGNLSCPRKLRNYLNSARI